RVLARIPGDVVQERRTREVVEWRLEIGPCVDEVWMGVEQRTQLLEIACSYRALGFGELRVRFERRDAFRGFDVVLECRPARKAILAGNDQLRVGERDRPRKDVLR